MIRLNKLLSLIILSVFFCFISCKTTKTKLQKKDWYKQSNDRFSYDCLKDFMLFSYYAKLGYHKGDNGIYYPIPYKVKLPYGLQSTLFSYGSDYFFYYRCRQVIHINMDPFGLTRINDTIYTLSNSGIADLTTWYYLEDEIPEMKIQIFNNRKNLVIQKDNAIIRLYNIKKKNYNKFLESAKSFEISK